MKLTREFMLGRSRARDKAYDGRFLTGVLSTGIYCLPSCPARPPKEENIRFFFDEQEAQRAGLRPCLRCRPDDFMRGFDPDLALVRRIAGRVRESPETLSDLAALRREFGVGTTRLNALFRRHYHTTPAHFLQRVRVARACRLLLDGDDPVIDVALDAGYESLSSFHDNFRRLTGLCPGDYRRLRDGKEFVLSLPRDFQRQLTLRYLARDPESPTEAVDGHAIARALRVGRKWVAVAIEIRAGAARCRVEAGGPLAAAEMAAVHEQVLRLLGLTTDPHPFERRLARTVGLSRLVEGRRGLRPPLTPEPFESLIWSLVGQQVNLAFAYRLRRRLLDLCGRKVDGLRAHPTPGSIARLDYADLTRRQYSRRKAEYVIDTARLVAEGKLPLARFAEEPASWVERRLLAVRGFGPWSTHYVLMRGCGFEDCLPIGDTGLTTALKDFFQLTERPGSEETQELMRPFTPHRSLATFHLWTQLGAPA